jgi:hypothetical protein
MPKNVLNMNDIIGNSYYQLKNIFGDKVNPGSFANFMPKDVLEKSDQYFPEEQLEEKVVGTQAPGSNILVKDGETIAKMTITELPTFLSSMNASSIGLDLLPMDFIPESVSSGPAGQKTPDVPLAPEDETPPETDESTTPVAEGVPVATPVEEGAAAETEGAPVEEGAPVAAAETEESSGPMTIPGTVVLDKGNQ